RIRSVALDQPGALAGYFNAGFFIERPGRKIVLPDDEADEVETQPQKALFQGGPGELPTDPSPRPVRVQSDTKFRLALFHGAQNRKPDGLPFSTRCLAF